MPTTASVPAPKRPTLTQRNKELRETLEAVEGDRQRVEEALGNAVLMLRQEEIGWAMPEENGYRGLLLNDMWKWSREIRTSLTGTRYKAPNPHMRNGLMLRHSFIWDGGIHYADVPGDTNTPSRQGKVNVQNLLDDPENKRNIFSSSARRRREHALFSDGLYVVIGDDKEKTLRPVPLHEISDTHRDERYEDEIVAYRWTRNEAIRLPGSQHTKGQLTGSRASQSYWVFVDWYDKDDIPDFIKYGEGDGEMVLKHHTAFDLHANRPDGAAFGSPDAIAAVVWARIIRDLIMNGVKMQDALAMFAFKATSPTRPGQAAAALELAKNVTAGSAATMGGENDLIPLNSAGKGYDFGSIGFVVSTMAASLHVSGIALSANTALAGSSYGAAKTLDLPGRMAMQTRRAEHIEFDERLLAWLGAPKATAYFDKYDDATDEYRAVQAAMLAWTTGTMTPEGFRGELEIIYGRKLIGAIPAGVIVPNNQKQIDDAAAAAAQKAVDMQMAKNAIDLQVGAVTPTSGAPKPATASTAAPDQGKSTGTGGSGHANDMPVKAK